MKPFLALLFILVGCSQVQTASKKESKPSPYPRIETGIKRICTVNQELDGYEERYIFDCKEDYSKDSRIIAGYGFRSKPGHPYTSGIRSPYPRGKVARTVDMISRNHALNETYLHIIDFAGGPDSHDKKSVIYLFPRTDIPKVTEVGNEVELLLPTGEKVFFDAGTGAINGGVMKEGAIDLHREYKRRAEPNVHYTGDYISVRLTHSFDEPAIAAEKAVIQQKDNICILMRGRLFNREGKLLTKSDDEFLAAINRECTTPFKF
ncbi:MAG: hypothetical protein V4598_11985 [Bdellovibrionota bacterium]